MSNNKKIYYINKKDNLIYDIKEVDEYVKKTLKKLSLKPTMFLSNTLFNAYFIPLTAEIEKEILSKGIDRNQEI